MKRMRRMQRFPAAYLSCFKIILKDLHRCLVLSASQQRRVSKFCVESRYRYRCRGSMLEWQCHYLVRDAKGMNCVYHLFMPAVLFVSE
jgi:hypothetical protein